MCWLESAALMAVQAAPSEGVFDCAPPLSRTCQEYVLFSFDSVWPWLHGIDFSFVVST